MAVICCATPSELYLEETRSTLQFASRAKLVKTHAKLNEVLDDRSLIRRLQKELAEARRLADGSGQIDHVKKLEEKAATAGSVARQAEEKLKRLQASILNSEFAFKSDADGNVKTDGQRRQRRMSEGHLLLGHATPTEMMHKATSPKTLPRPRKKTKVTKSKPPSPHVERALFRQALTLKSDSLQTLQTKNDELARTMAQLESQLAQFQKENKKLCLERDVAMSESDKLASQVQELESVAKTQASEIANRDEAIQESQRTIDQQCGSLHEMEVSLQQARQERDEHAETMRELERQNSNLCSTTENLKTEHAAALSAYFEQSENMKMKLMEMQSDKETAEEHAKDLAVKLEACEQNLCKTGEELAQSQQRFNELQSSLEARCGELEKLQTELQVSQHERCAFQEEVHTLKTELEDVHKNMQELDDRNHDLLRVIEELKLGKEKIEIQHLALVEETMNIKAQRNAEVADFLEKQELMSSERTELRREMESAQERTQQLTSALEIANERFANSEANLQQTLQVRDELSGIVKHLEAENSTFRTEVERLTSEQEAAAATFQTQIAEANAALDASRAAIEKSNQEVERVALELNFEKDKHQKTQEQLAQLTDKWTQLEEYNKSLNAEVGRLQSAYENCLVEMNNTTVQHADALEALQKQAESLKHEARKLSDELNAEKENHQQAQQDRDGLALKLQEYEEQMVLSTTENESLKKTNDGLAKKLEQTHSQLHASREENIAVKEEIESYRLKLADADENVQRCQREQAQHAVEAEKLEKRVSESLAEVDRLTEELNKAQAGRNEKTEELRTLKEELDAVTKTSERALMELSGAKERIEQQEQELDDVTNGKRRSDEQILALITKINESNEQHELAVEELRKDKSELISQLELLSKEKEEYQCQAAKLEIAFKAAEDVLQKTSEKLMQSTLQQDQLSAAAKQLEVDVGYLKSDIENLKVQNEAENNAWSEKLDLCSSELHNTEEELVSAKNECNRLEVELESANDKLRQAIENLDSVVDAKNQQTALTIELNDQIITLKAEIESVNAQHNKAVKDLQDAVDDLNSKLERAEAIIHDRDRMASELESVRNLLLQSESNLERSRAEQLEQTSKVKQLEDEQAAMRSELESTKERLQATVSEFADKLEVQQQEAEVSSQTASAYETQLESLRSKLAESQECLQSTRAEYKELEVAMKQLENRNAEQTADLQSARLMYEEKVAEYRAEIEKTQEEIRSYQIELAAEKQKVESLTSERDEINNLKSEHQNAASKLIEELNIKLSTCQHEVERLENENSNLATEIVNQKTAYDNLVADLEKVAQNRNAALQERDQTNLNLQSTSSALSVAQERILHLTAMLANGKQDVDSVSRKLQATIDEKDRAIAKLRELQDANEKLNDEASQLRVQVSSIQAETRIEIEQLRASLVDAGSRMNELQLKLDSSNCDLQHRTDELIKVHDMLESSTRSLNESKTRIHDLEDELESKVAMLSQSVASIEAEKEHLERMYAESSSTINHLKATIADLEEENIIIKQRLNAAVDETKDDRGLLDLQRENDELKLLLASSNERADKTRTESDAVISQLETTERQLQDAYLMLEESEKGIEELRKQLDTAEKERQDAFLMLEESEAALAKIRAANSTLTMKGGCPECKTLSTERTRLEGLLESQIELMKECEEKINEQAAVEKRMLIEEAESSMEALRQEIVELRESLSKSEQEAYAARELNEELRDQVKRNMQHAIQLESRVAALQKENSTFKTAATRNVTAEASKIASLEVELRNVQEAKLAMEQQTKILQEKIQELCDEKTNIIVSTQQQQTPPDAKRLKEKNQQLSEEVAKLHRTLELTKTNADICSLNKEIAALKSELESKEERIKKLKTKTLTQDQLSKIKQIQVRNPSYTITFGYEAISSMAYFLCLQRENGEYQRKLAETKEQVAQLAAMREEHSAFKSKLADAEKQIAELRKERESLSFASASADNAEMTRLIFDKNLLEKKLKKYIVHSQSLEDEKLGMLRVIRSTQRDAITDNDVSSAVIRLCDRLVALEEECEALSKAESHLVPPSSELERLRSINSTLEAQVSELKQNYEVLARAEKELKLQVEAYRSQAEKFALQQSEARSESPEELEKKASHIRFLEQENLQLISDITNTRKQLQNAKAQLNMMRIKGMEVISKGGISNEAAKQNSPPRESTFVRKRLRPDFSIERKNVCSGESNRLNHSVDKENGSNTMNSTSKSKRTEHADSDRKPLPRAPGLGEALNHQEDTTGECKQS